MIMNLNAYPTETIFPFTEAQFVTLVNNGSVPITYNFDASVTETGNVTLQPGQSSTDFRTCTTLHVQSSNGIQPIQLELEREISDQFGTSLGFYSSTTTNTFNTSNQITQSQEKDTNGNVLSTTTYTYNSLNQMTQSVQTFPNGHSITTTYTYDTNGNMIQSVQSYS